MPEVVTLPMVIALTVGMPLVIVVVSMIFAKRYQDRH